MSSWTEPALLRITCARGLAHWLRHELTELGFEPLDCGLETAVEVKGTLADAQRLNLCLRTPFHVLYPLASFRCDSDEDLYHGVAEIPWEDWIHSDGYVSVVSRVQHESVQNSMWPNLKTKDAIVDRILEQCGQRPDSGPKRDYVVVTLHWFGTRATVYLDTSGKKLSDRGYRHRPGPAPLRESLAAGIVLATGYDGSAPFVNPMCGSGTLAIEAALIASRRAPGLLRSNFALTHLRGFDREAWDALRGELRQVSRDFKPAPIVATDHDPAVIEDAKHNAQTAGVGDLIRFEVCDMAETPLPEGTEGGIVILNPAYGERLGDAKELETVYGQIGDFFKQSCQGYTGWLFTGNVDLLKSVGLRASRKKPFFNGEIPCKLARYLLFKGRHGNRPERATAPEQESQAVEEQEPRESESS